MIVDGQREEFLRQKIESVIDRDPPKISPCLRSPQTTRQACDDFLLLRKQQRRYMLTSPSLSYNSQTWKSQLRSLSRVFPASLLVLLLICKTAASQQEASADSPWAKPAHDLVQEVLAQAGSPSSVSFSAENKSAMTSADAVQARKAIEAQFRTARIRLVKPEAAIAEVKFTFSENTAGYLWIAEVKQGPTRQVNMLPFAKTSAASNTSHPVSLELRKTLVFAQSSPILDFALADDGSLLLLEPEKISVYRRGPSTWKLVQSLASTHSVVWPRDLRGRLYIDGNSFEALLPGTKCTGSLEPQFTSRCFESDDPWPLLHAGSNGPSAFFSTTRNFFSGVLGGSESSHTVPPFFSAAIMGQGDNALWVLSGIDGHTRLYNKFSQLLKTTPSRGSDLASLQSACGSHSQLLVTSADDATESDSVQAFEIQNKDSMEVSEPLSFDGRIAALWSGADGKNVGAVVDNPMTGNYEAFAITVSCGR